MDLYDIYNNLFPDISEEEYYKLPSPVTILEEAGWDGGCQSHTIRSIEFSVVYLDKAGPRHTVVINVQGTLIRISDWYNDEWGYDCNPEVTIVEAVERQVTITEYRAKQ
ncbi:hypothetical protein [Microcoleus phage My-WqHQDG]|nr:hypothetical protein [Microcoleus phage My-WqHQDG]